MTTTSNLYADKVYAEHPNALYPLDESADYVSLITDAQRTVSIANGWTLTNVTSTSEYAGSFPTQQLDTILNQITLPDLAAPSTTLVATNLISVPQPTLASWGKGFGTGGTGTFSIQTDTRFPGQAAYELVWSTVPSNNSSLYISSNSATVSAGQTYCISIRYAVTSWSGFTPGLYAPSGTLGASTVVDLGSGIYEFRQLYTHSSGTTASVTLNPASSSIASMVSGSTLRAGGASVVLSSTLTGEYFDGDSVSGDEAGEYSYAWTTPASPNASTSTKSLIGAVPTQTATMISPVIHSGSNLVNDKGSFAVGAYIYPFAKKITVEIGYQYTDLSSSTTIVNTRLFSIVDVQQWQFVSETFLTPTNFSNLKLIIKVTYTGPSGPPSTPSSYYFLLHGLTVGQQSEEFNVESLGTIPVSIPSTITPAISGKGVEINKYGLQTISGYYMADGEVLSAINSGMPMVFGASNSTRILPRNAGANPSLVIPGEGFFNQSGRYRNMTAEFWIKIQSYCIDPKRIFGPVNSDDGLYVHDGFISLKLNKEIGTYFVSEWDRPMLVAIRISAESASLVINGQEVIQLTFADSDVIFPDIKDINGKDQDWLGFYAYQDVPSLEIDSVGIYPYSVPNIVEKRRWVYGQGVEPSKNVSGTDISESVLIDYSFANYSKSYLYPDIGRWQQGINENLLIQNNTISTLKYELPEIKLSSGTEQSWYEDNEAAQSISEPFVSLRPNSSWNSTSGHLLFPTINTLSQDLKAFYALLETDELNTSKQTIFYIENQATKDVLSVTLEGSVVEYSFTSGSQNIVDYVFYSQTDHIPGTYLAIGLDIETVASSFDGKLTAFFGSKQNLKFYVCGNRNLDVSATFSGKIFRVGFCTSRNFKKISKFFLENGLMAGYLSAETLSLKDSGNKNFGNTTNYVDPETNNLYWGEFADAGSEYFGNAVSSFGEIYDGGSPYSILSDVLLSHIGSYTLTPKNFLGKFYLDVSTNGYWQDYLPLSYFTKYVVDGSNNKYLDVDFIQFNVNYPQIARFAEGISNFDDICVRTYVSFQYLKNSMTIDPESFTNNYAPLDEGVVVPGTDWETSIYEVVDDAVIYPPPEVDFNTVAMVVHVEISSRGITENPINIKTLQLSSQSLNGFRPNPVGTKFGSDIFPYRKSGEYFDYKGRNPYSIYKGSTPYFYLTGTSGIKLKRLSSLDLDRGISIPINKKASSFHKVSAIQMAIRWDEIQFSSTPVELFEIKSTYQHIKFYADADGYDKKRGRIYAINAFTGEKQDGVTLYINGRRVKTGMINAKAWTLIGISFSSPMDFSEEVGALRVTSNLLFNNLSFFKITEQQESSNFSYRKWFDITAIDGINKNWYYWRNLQVIPGQEYTWRDVLFIASAKQIQISPAQTYKRYTGTDRFIVDTDKTFKIQGYRYLFYNNIEWKTSIVDPV